VVASRTLELREASQTFTFDGLPAPVVPSSALRELSKE